MAARGYRRLLMIATEQTASTADQDHHPATTADTAAGLSRLVANVAKVHQHLRRGQTLWREGAPGKHYWLVRRGVLVSIVELPAGRRCLLAFHYPGELILNVPGLKAGASILSLTDVEVDRLPASAVDELVRSERCVAACLIEAWTCQARRLATHCAILGRLDGQERVVSLLLEMTRHLGKALTDRIDVKLPITREDIADYLGLNADTVSRILSRLRRDGLIDFTGRSGLHILDWSRLQDLSPFGEPHGAGRT